jgi:hypothetical protein
VKLEEKERYMFDIFGLAFMCMIGFMRIMHQKEKQRGMDDEGVVMVVAFTCLYLHLLFYMFVWGGFSTLFFGFFTYLCAISRITSLLCPLNLLCVENPPPYPYIGLLLLVAIASITMSNNNLETVFVLMFAMAVVFIE